ncbi:DUF2268 domain-containing protein [Afifella sp. JA880]|uniref:DUF2268 domain-containing protein n=1 Tax=Afifella sp. JA880 TaxID=2975280 RepID=UPI0021BB6356|nr:DUF2268 domain-containing protein [Afifella sp. JA880]MCT8266841.1 DUF2268 domain-containing protein [Afifella sp. JA880]
MMRYAAGMSSLTLHVLDARGTLADIRAWLRDALTATHEKAAALMPLRPLDVVVQSGRWVIPEKGHVGRSPKPGVIFLTLDPGNPALRPNADMSLERMFAHELHHAARWDGPGYGASLGEALVSEGLAGHFVQELFGGPPEPWERLPDDDIRPHSARVADEWDRTDYNHEAWFYGRGDLPRWLGYSLGFRLIENYLQNHPSSRAATLAETSAQEFRPTLELL